VLDCCESPAQDTIQIYLLVLTATRKRLEMDLSNVSKTAIVTLRCHALESQKKRPVLKDPMAEHFVEQLAGYASQAERAQLFNRRLAPALTRHIALRARKYDSLADEFIAGNPSCTVVNLGCGFDTRYWRIQHEGCRYIELDLPGIVQLKREVLGNDPCYEMIGCSVLDPSWIDQVCSKGNTEYLLIAEGLFMYLPKAEVIDLFKVISERFQRSRIVLEVVTEKYTRGFWKQLVIMKMNRELGFDAGSSYNFGIRDAAELETYGPGIKVVDEWSYLEDPDMRPRIYRHLGISRTQWTVIATVN
jgi:methyltransferase (TIGR00027 family)